MKKKLPEQPNMYILGIDPGDVESGYCIIDIDMRPVEFGKIDNHDLLRKLYSGDFKSSPTHIGLEMVACYGMGVGKNVFETCVWIGRYIEACKEIVPPEYVYRRDEKLNLCGSMQAKDSNIKLALKDRFAPHDSNGGKGTKNNPGWFYGFSEDMWTAFAVAVTYRDMLDGFYTRPGNI